LRHHPAARGQRSIIDRQTAAKAGAVPPALFLLRPQNCGAVAHALADTGRVEDDRKLSRFYNGFYLQGDRSTTYTERAADCKLARLVGRPSKKGRWATMTHDYKRHGTTTLFAALNVHPLLPCCRSNATVGGQKQVPADTANKCMIGSTMLSAKSSFA
jgi:hypothetical protein